MKIDDVLAMTDTVMTKELIRLFAYAGCDPTTCHACGKRIKAGQVFRLIPHKRTEVSEQRDEMCCARCGEPELRKRDKRESKPVFVPDMGNRYGGFSRVSKTPPTIALAAERAEGIEG